jgi:hypothetical protein
LPRDIGLAWWTLPLTVLARRTHFIGRQRTISRGIVRPSSTWPWFGKHGFFILTTYRKITNTAYRFDKNGVGK